jgi:hypothetical protein
VLDFVAASRYLLEGVVAGTVETSSLGGTPRVSLQVYGDEVQRPQLRESVAGLEITGLLGERPDLDSTQLLLLLPRVNVADEPVEFAGVAIVVTALSTIGGPNVVNGVVQSYEIHPVVGRATAVEF